MNNATSNPKLCAALNRLESLLSVGQCPVVRDAASRYECSGLGTGAASLTLIETEGQRVKDGPFVNFQRGEFDRRLADGRIVVE